MASTMSNHRDRLAKCILEESLDSLGITRRELEIDPAFLPRADLCFFPHPLPAAQPPPSHLRLLVRMVVDLTLFEIETHPPDRDQVLDFLCKQLNLRNRRRQKGEGDELPFLWIITCGRPVSAFAQLEVKPAAGWPPGFYLMAPWTRVGFVVVPELPTTRDTLLLRMMGPARVRDQALGEIRAIPATDPEHRTWSSLLVELRHAIGSDSLIPQEDQEAFMTAARAAVEKFKAEVYEEGHQDGIKDGRREGRREAYPEVLKLSILDVWVNRFAAPLGDPLAERLAAIDNPRVLRQVLAVVARAADSAGATAEAEAILTRSANL